MENNRKLMFTNAYFGKLYLNRKGEKVVYLSTERHEARENSDGFVLIHVALERHVKYVDGDEKTFHVTYFVNEYGEVNEFTQSKNDEDIVREYWEEVGDDTINKKTDAASAGLIEGTDDWRVFRIGFKWGFREGLNYQGEQNDE